MTWSEQHKSNLKLLLDPHTKAVAGRLPQYADAFSKRVTDDLQRPFAAFVDKVESIRQSGRYSPNGERAELRPAARAAKEHLATVTADTVSTLDGQLADRRATLTKPKTSPTDPVLALVTELRHQELRAQLRGLDPLALQVRIRQAIQDGADRTLLDALEGAPPGFPIAPPALVQEAREQIALANDPTLRDLTALRNAYTFAIGAVEQTVMAASGLQDYELAS